MAKIVMPKNSALLEEVEAVLKIYYDAGGWLSNDEYKRQLMAMIGDGQYASSYTKKAQITSYFGLTEWEDISNVRSLRRITTRGKSFYENLLAKNYDGIFEDLMLSLEKTTFGRNNFGCPDSDSDVEPPILFIRAIVDLGYLTYKEFAFLLWKLEDCGGNYTDAKAEIRSMRSRMIFDLPEEATKYTDAKPIMVLIRWGFLAEDDNSTGGKHIIINPKVLAKYKQRIMNLKIYNIDKNVMDETNDNVVMPTSDIFSMIKQRYETGDYPHMEGERLAQTYSTFKGLYGKDALKALSGKELLYRIFGTKAQDNLSLTYAIERGKEYADFGSCRGAYGWANVLTCFEGRQWQYCTSASDITNITEEEAIEKAELLIGDLVLALEIIEEYDAQGKLTNAEGYEELDQELKEVLGDLYNKPRFKKHLAMLYPHLFMNMFDYILKKDGWLNRVFTTLQLELSGNWYTQSGRFSVLAKELGIPNLDLYQIVKSLLEESGEVSGETAGDADEMLQDYKENEKRFREWMATQTSQTGKPCTPSMISNNSGALNKVCQLMDIVEYPDLESIFQITNIDTFNDVRSIIKANPNYDEVDKACSNRYLTSALKWYTRYLDEMFAPEVLEPETTVEAYDKEKFLADVFMSSDEYEQLKKLLFYKRNVILQGAPGVGKTYLAKKLVYSIIEKMDDRYIEMVQFHQNYSYEDFIMGYKPVDEGFELKPGVFYNFCKKAESEPENKFFFIIDEINRGNLSKIFGELMMLIEGDKRGIKNRIKLAYKNELFYVPANVFIIGMMNTADRSLAMMDYALRRRFSFFDVLPAFDRTSFKNHILQYVGASVADKVVSRFKDLNAKIADENSSNLGKGYCIGHSYFCVPPVEGQSDEEWYDAIIEYEISPLLYEYWWDDKDRADECINELKR